MLHPEKIARLNELAKQSKMKPLTPEEAEERRQLREEYLANFRSTFRDHLERIHLVDEDDGQKD